MKRVRVNFLLNCLAFGALALASLPSTAKAQAANGKFTLPSEVHWAYLTLPKGDYSFEVTPSGATTMIQLHMEGSSPKSFMIPVQRRDQLPASATESRLVLDRIGGDLYVSKLELGCVGTMFLYSPPGTKELLLSKNFRQGQRMAPSGK